MTTNPFYVNCGSSWFVFMATRDAKRMTTSDRESMVQLTGSELPGTFRWESGKSGQLILPRKIGFIRIGYRPNSKKRSRPNSKKRPTYNYRVGKGFLECNKDVNASFRCRFHERPSPGMISYN